jgi:hypothetical protein
MTIGSTSVRGENILTWMKKRKRRALSKYIAYWKTRGI